MRSAVLALAAGLLPSVEAGVFQKVIDELQGAQDDAKAAQQTNDDEFKKIQCLAQELIDEANEKIPKAQETIEMSNAKIEELTAANEELSIEINDLQAQVAKNTKELADKTRVRNEENTKYKKDKKDMEAGMGMMDQAIGVLTAGTANFVQVHKDVASKLSGDMQEAFIQLTSTEGMKTSGQVIGILNSMKDTFSENLTDMTAAENLAEEYFQSYKERTESQIAADTKTYKAKQGEVADNAGTLSTTRATLKAAKETLATMEEQLTVQTAHLEKHTGFHLQMQQESMALIQSIQSAIDLLSSPEALKVASASEEHMKMPGFLQTSKHFHFRNLEKHQRHSKKAANEYSGWGAIYRTIDAMTASLNESLKEADEEFLNCEEALSMHVATDKDLRAQHIEQSGIKAASEQNIETAKGTIKTMNELISSKQEEIKNENGAINDLVAVNEKETAEAADAEKLFNEAIKLLSTNTGATLDVHGQDDDATTGEAAYDTSKIAEGTSRVTAIVEKVRDEMISSVNQLVTDNKNTITEKEGTIKGCKDTIANSQETLADAQQSLADNETELASAEQKLMYINEGLTAELSWFGDKNSGANLDSRGQTCMKWLGREEFGKHEDRAMPAGSSTGSGKKKKPKGGQAAATSDFSATDKLAGDGDYHTQTKAQNDEKQALKELKELIEGVESTYTVPQSF